MLTAHEIECLIDHADGELPELLVQFLQRGRDRPTTLGLGGLACELLRAAESESLLPRTTLEGLAGTLEAEGLDQLRAGPSGSLPRLFAYAVATAVQLRQRLTAPFLLRCLVTLPEVTTPQERTVQLRLSAGGLRGLG